MRRPARLVLGVLAASSLVLTPVLAGTAAAAPGKGGAGTAAAAKPAAAKPAARPAKPAAKPVKPLPAKRNVVLVGIVTATPTVVSSGSATATVVTVKVFGGDKAYRGGTVVLHVDRSALVKRNHGRAARYELRQGDKVTVHARRSATGALTVTRVLASGRPATVVPVVPATPTATTTATTRP